MNGLRVHSEYSWHCPGYQHGQNMEKSTLPETTVCPRTRSYLRSCCLWEMKMKPTFTQLFRCRVKTLYFHPMWCYCNEYWSCDHVLVMNCDVWDCKTLIPFCYAPCWTDHGIMELSIMSGVRNFFQASPHGRAPLWRCRRGSVTGWCSAAYSWLHFYTT